MTAWEGMPRRWRGAGVLGHPGFLGQRLLRGVGRVGLGGEEGGECGALSVGELGTHGWGVDHLLTLLRWHLAEVEDGTGHEAPAGNRERVQLLHGAVPLLTLGRSEAFQSFGAVEHTGPLFRAHIVESAQLLQLALLDLGRELSEAGFVLECTLLFWQRKIAMVLHPLREVRLILDRSAGPV